MRRQLSSGVWALAIALTLAVSLRSQTQPMLTTGSALPGTCTVGASYILIGGTAGFYICTLTNTWTALAPVAASGGVGGALPSGFIGMVDTGVCPVGTTEVSGMDGRMPFGTVLAHADVGGTGGADAITPAGTNGALTFTGTSAQATSSVSGGTPTGTNGAPVFSGTPFSSIITHTHPSTLVVQGGTTAATTGTHLMTSTATGGSARAIAAGDAIATPTTAGSVASITPAGTNSAPVFTGSALGTHAHTLTPAGTINTPAFTGTQFDNRSAYKKVIFCKAN